MLTSFSGVTGFALLAYDSRVQTVAASNNFYSVCFGTLPYMGFLLSVYYMVRSQLCNFVTYFISMQTPDNISSKQRKVGLCGNNMESYTEKTRAGN